MDEELMHDHCCATCRHCAEQDIEEITCYCTLKEQEMAADEVCNKFEY